MVESLNEKLVQKVFGKELKAFESELESTTSIVEVNDLITKHFNQIVADKDLETKDKDNKMRDALMQAFEKSAKDKVAGFVGASKFDEEVHFLSDFDFKSQELNERFNAIDELFFALTSLKEYDESGNVDPDVLNALSDDVLERFRVVEALLADKANLIKLMRDAGVDLAQIPEIFSRLENLIQLVESQYDLDDVRARLGKTTKKATATVAPAGPAAAAGGGATAGGGAGAPPSGPSATSPSSSGKPMPTSSGPTTGFKEFRPEVRRDWTPYDYISEAIKQVKPPGQASLPGGTDLRSEFKTLVETHPKYRDDLDYWTVAMQSWNVLYGADPPTRNTYTIDFKAWKEKNFHGSGYDVAHVMDVLRHEKYGNVSLRILALLEIIVSNEDFEYTDKRGNILIQKGQFVARTLDGRQGALARVARKIVKEQGWLKGIPEDVHLFDVVFNISTSLDLRGHTFLDYSSGAVTKGFGGEDYTWISKPEATIAYDMNRYGREPKASFYLLSTADVPDEWHQRSVFNDALVIGEDIDIKSEFSGPIQKFLAKRENLSDSVAAERVKAYLTLANFKGALLEGISIESKKNPNDYIDSILNTLNGINFQDQVIIDGLNEARLRLEGGEDINSVIIDLSKITDKLNRHFRETVTNLVTEYSLKSGESKKEKAEEKTHEVREWFNLFASEEDIEMCMDKLLPEPSKQHLSAVQKIDGEYYFRNKGATFPTLYQFYTTQVIKKGFDKKIDDAGVISSLIDETVLFNDAEFEKLTDKYTGAFVETDINDDKLRGFKMYLIALEGWTTVLDVIKEAPKPVNGQTLLRNIDSFTSALGKIKLVKGAHEYITPMLTFLFLVKQFKYLEPRDYEEYRRIRALALKKFNSGEGGGIPENVRLYATWLLDEAKSNMRPEDRPGDFLRPMDPSLLKIANLEEHEAGRGLENESWYLSKAKPKMKKYQTIFNGLLAPPMQIPLGHIKWDDQSTDTTGKK